MSDYLIKGITKDGFLKVSAMQSRDLVEKMRNIHKTLPLATAALGRALTAAGMMGADLKGENASLTLQIRGDGQLGAITAVSDSRGNVRGYLQNPALDLSLRVDGKLAVGEGVGKNGLLTVIKDIGSGEPFSGKVELLSGEIAEDIAAYFAASEQVPAVCALGVTVGTDQSVLCAGGYIIQVMPGTPDGLVDILEARVREAPNISAQLIGGMDIEEAVFDLLHGFGLEVLERREVGYECKCSRKKVESALLSMGQDELSRLIEEEGRAEVTCQFCDSRHQFDKGQLEGLLSKIK